MRGRGAGLHVENLRIVRAQAHGTRCALDGHLGLAEPDLDPATEYPCRCEVRIEHKGLIDESVAVIKITGAESESKTCRTESDRVIAPQVGGSPCQPRSLRNLLHAVGCPTVRLAPDIASRRQAIGHRE